MNRGSIGKKQRKNIRKRFLVVVMLKVYLYLLHFCVCYTLLYLQIQDNFLLTTNASVFTHCCACMYVCSFTSDKGNAFRLRIVIYIWRVIKFLISFLIREG